MEFIQKPPTVNTRNNKVNQREQVHMAGQLLNVIKTATVFKGSWNTASSTTKNNQITGMNISFSNLFWVKLCLDSYDSPILFPPVMQPTVKIKAITEEKAFCNGISKSLFLFHKDFSLNLGASE